MRIGMVVGKVSLQRVHPSLVGKRYVLVQPQSLKALAGRADRNAQTIYRFVEQSPWLANLAAEPRTRSNTSVCLSIVDAEVQALGPGGEAAFARAIAAALEKEGVAYDVDSYRDAPPGLRIWCGATVETSDVEALMPWLDWAFQTAKAAGLLPPILYIALTVY